MVTEEDLANGALATGALDEDEQVTGEGRVAVSPDGTSVEVSWWATSRAHHMTVEAAEDHREALVRLITNARVLVREAARR